MTDEHAVGAGPVTAAERIASLDVLRGVAVLGILLMNIGGFASQWVENPLRAETGTLNLWTWIVTSVYFEGTMRGLFSLLFGAGVILLTTRAESKGQGAGVADIYYRRTIWLLIFGAVHGYLMLWPGDILFYYGVVGLFLFPLRRLRPRTLILAAMVILVLGSLREVAFRADFIEREAEAAELEARVEAGETLDEDDQETLDGWRAEAKAHDHGPQDIDIGEIRRSGYIENLAGGAEAVMVGHTKELYLWGFWDALMVMMLGMALMKLGVFGADLPTRTYALMVLLGYGVGLTINILEVRHILVNDGSLRAHYDTWPLYDLARLPMTLGHVGVVMLICKANVLTALLRPLAAVGRMALTNYLMQTVICVLVFYGFGLGLHGRLDRFELKLFVIGVWIVQLVISPLWLRAFRFGPAEWLWRSLTYVKLQPFRAVTVPRPPDASMP